MTMRFLFTIYCFIFLFIYFVDNKHTFLNRFLLIIGLNTYRNLYLLVFTLLPIYTHIFFLSPLRWGVELRCIPKLTSLSFPIKSWNSSHMISYHHQPLPFLQAILLVAIHKTFGVQPFIHHQTLSYTDISIIH